MQAIKAANMVVSFLLELCMLAAFAALAAVNTTLVHLWGEDSLDPVGRPRH